MISFVDNLLGNFRRVILNTITAIFLMLILIGILGSLFESYKVETENKILYL